MLHEQRVRGGSVQDAVVFQLAALMCLVGMALCWTGVLSRYAGFYDLTVVWNSVLWGIPLGALVAVLEFQSLFLPYFETVLGGQEAAQGPSLPVLLWWVFMHSAVVHLVLRRTSIRSTGGHVTAGWALGTAMGGMHGLFLSAQLLGAPMTLHAAHRWLGALAFGLLMPRLEAVLTAWQGQLMLQGRRIGAVVRAAAWRMVMLTLAYFAFFQPLAWIAAIGVLGLTESRVDSWVWGGLDKRAQRVLRRIRATAARERRQAQTEEE